LCFLNDVNDQVATAISRGAEALILREVRLAMELGGE
jgi:hypothetical protein